MAGLAHDPWSDGTQHDIATGGLTSLGKEAIKEMNRLGIVVDVGHLNTVGYWASLEASGVPVVFSHRSPR